jgi:long-chain acyl-CoA synthetase
VYRYSDVQREAVRMRGVLHGRNLVLCICENCIPSLLGYICLVVIDQVIILVESGQSTVVINSLLATYRPAYLWLPESRSCEIENAIVVLRVGHYVLVKLASGVPSPTISERLQLLLTTSGSTGSGKMVRLGRSNLLANAAAITAYLGIRSDDIAITTLPFSYSFGLSILHTHLMAGASIQVTQLSPLSRDFWIFAQQRRVTSLSGVPYTFDMFKRIRFERFELPAIRYLSQAGGKMGEDTLNYLHQVSREKAWRVFLMYGQTEASARMSYLPSEWLGRKLGSIGQAIPGGRFELVDGDGELIEAAGVPGELIYYGKNVALGYAKCASDLARGDDWNGRLTTGDLAFRDEDGFYYVTGRLKRFVKIFGKRISLDEVETLLMSGHPNCEFACHGQDDLLRIACAGKVDCDNVVSFLSHLLSLHRSAINCISVDHIPRLSNGKVNYTALA